MPHPERFVRAIDHPRWTRLGKDLPTEGQGIKFFKGAVAVWS
jgi:phosphoribosylformylglycinamidine synthase